MNLFAINWAELNGSTEVWSWYGDASVVVNGAGDIQRGLTGEGSADVVVNGNLAPRLDIHAPFDPADMMVSAYGDAILGLVLAGDAQVRVSATGKGTRWVLGESAFQIVIEADGDGQVVQPAAASFSIVVSSTLDGMVASTVREDGLGQIVLNGLLNEHVAKRQLIEGEAQVHLASVGSGYMIITGPAGEAAMAILADGEARLGEKISLEGDAVLEVYARGELSSLHYEYGEGDAVIIVQAGSMQAGIPDIPTDYVPAPRARTIIVQRDPRALLVQRENRSI